MLQPATTIDAIQAVQFLFIGLQGVEHLFLTGEKLFLLISSYPWGIDDTVSRGGCLNDGIHILRIFVLGLLEIEVTECSKEI